MNYVPRGPKKPASMTLGKALVRDARALTNNLSQTVERLLSESVESERRNNAEQQRRIDATIALLNELYDAHGGLEEFSQL